MARSISIWDVYMRRRARPKTLWRCWHLPKGLGRNGSARWLWMRSPSFNRSRLKEQNMKEEAMNRLKGRCVLALLFFSLTTPGLADRSDASTGAEKHLQRGNQALKS